jgi:hypothetical protein
MTYLATNAKCYRAVWHIIGTGGIERWLYAGLASRFGVA